MGTIEQSHRFAGHGNFGHILICERESGVREKPVDGIISLHFLLRLDLRTKPSVLITKANCLVRAYIFKVLGFQGPRGVNSSLFSESIGRRRW